MPSVLLKKTFPLILLLALLTAGCSALTPPTEEPTPTPVPTPVIPAKPTYTVQRGEIVRSTTFTGRVVPAVEVGLFFSVGGRVEKIHVGEGDQVTSGQLLAELDTGGSQYDLRRAEINLEMAKLRLELEKIQTPAWSPQYETVIAMRQYETELAQLALDELQAYLRAAQIVSPLAGTVRSLALTEGWTVEAFKNVIVVADLNQLEIAAELSPDQMAVLQEGMTGTVAPVGDPSQSVSAVIRALPYPYGATAKAEAGGIKNTRVTCDISTSRLGLGDLAQVVVTLEKRTDALWLPPAAIRLFNGRTFVIVKEADGQQRRVDVRIGISSNERVEILDGLTEGQLVLAP